jgi:hypothetical protein
MIRWPFYPAEALAFGIAFILTLLMQRRKLKGANDVFLIQVPIAIKAAWAIYLSLLAFQAGGDFPPSPDLAAVSQSLTFLMGLCLVLLFTKRVWQNE